MQTPQLAVLVVGNGGREHALALALARDPAVTRLYCAPGNPGTASVATNYPLNINDPRAVVTLARRLRVDLVVVGPEAPLVAGVADAVRGAGLACFGPSAAAARLEGSKVFAKAFMARHGVPTAAYESFTELGAALAYLEKQSYPLVIKDSALAAGKGVTVARTRAEALGALGAALTGGGLLTGAAIGAAVGGLAGAVWADRNNDGVADGYVYNGQYYAGEPTGYANSVSAAPACRSVGGSAAVGAAGGAALGAGVGAVTGGLSVPVGALIGAAVGGLEAVEGHDRLLDRDRRPVGQVAAVAHRRKYAGRAEVGDRLS